MELFYYNGRAFEKTRRVIYIWQGVDGPGGVKRIVYKKGRNVRGWRKPYDRPVNITSGS